MATTPLRSLKGFEDILPKDVARWLAVESIARETAARYHFGEIRTPTLEAAAVFHKGVGEASDIVGKEMYTFTDRDGTDISLRPEGTAGVVRAVIEGGLLNDQGSRAKVFYLCNNFRHERPQKGRVREHHQFGVEAFGVAEPEQDVECIQLQLDFYAACGLRDLALRLNSMGDRESKARYRDVLVAALSPKRGELSEDSQRRLESNPLRILDSKDPRDIAACKDVPPARESLSDKSSAHFARVQELLSKRGDAFTLDGTLVRGFDYYTDTLWEVTAGGLGSQNAVGGGGRYDNLVEALGGKPTPGVGFGSGLERLLIALEAQGVALPVASRPLVWLVHQSPAARDANLALLAEARHAGVRADMDLGTRAMKAQMKMADREKATHALITGDAELAAGTVQLKDLSTGEQRTLERPNVLAALPR